MSVLSPEIATGRSVFCRACGQRVVIGSHCGACGAIDSGSPVNLAPVPIPSSPPRIIEVAPAATSPGTRVLPGPSGQKSSNPINVRVAAAALSGRPVASSGLGRSAAVLPVPKKSRASKWRNFLPIRIWKRYFPPVRLVWIFLLVIVWNGQGFLNEQVAWPLLLLPVVCVATDMALQSARFPKLRIPDAALANGLFLSVILWPTEVSLSLIAVAAATVAIRHFVRVASHPVLNPAAVGVTIAAAVFALPQPWHVGVTLNDTILVLILGLILWSRALHTWRLWAVYFVTNIALTIGLADYLSGTQYLWLIVQTSVLGATPVFYGMFMVTEPRTAPTARRMMLVFGGLVGFAAAFFPFLFAYYISLSALGVIAPYLALFAGNIFTIALPSARGARRAAPKKAPISATRTPVHPIARAALTPRLGAMLGPVVTAGFAQVGAPVSKGSAAALVHPPPRNAVAAVSLPAATPVGAQVPSALAPNGTPAVSTPTGERVDSPEARLELPPSSPGTPQLQALELPLPDRPIEAAEAQILTAAPIPHTTEAAFPEDSGNSSVRSAPESIASADSRPAVCPLCGGPMPPDLLRILCDRCRPVNAPRRNRTRAAVVEVSAQPERAVPDFNALFSPSPAPAAPRDREREFRDFWGLKSIGSQDSKEGRHVNEPLTSVATAHPRVTPFGKSGHRHAISPSSFSTLGAVEPAGVLRRSDPGSAAGSDSLESFDHGAPGSAESSTAEIPTNDRERDRWAGLSRPSGES